MKKLILIIIISVFPNSLFANYPFIDPIDYTLPECDIKDNKVISKNKCIGEVKENSFTYFGEIENKRPQGNGYLYSSQAEYWGNFDKGILQGYATMSIPSKNYTFYGDFKNYQRTGFATDLDSSNGKYIGDYNEEQREGSGKYLEIKSGKIYNEKWKENKRVDRELTDSTFREYDSGIGFKFNHAGHLSLLSKNMLVEQIKKLPDWQQAIYQARNQEMVAFWGSNALNLLNHEKKNGQNFDRVTVEYDFIDEEEAELIFSYEQAFQGTYNKKYRYALINFSSYYENTLAYNVIIEVNDRYYTIGYMSPYETEFEKNKSEDDFNFFANSWEFDVPKNEVN